MPDSIRALYPGSKLIIALALGISAFIVPTFWFGFAAFGFAVVVAFVCGEGRAYLKLVRNSLLILLIFMFVMRLLFSGGDTIYWQWGYMIISAESLAVSLAFVSGVLALGSMLLLFFMLTPVKDITAALSNAGLPPSGTYVVLSAMQMIPEMRKQSATIMDAQKTRGVETEGTLFTRIKAFVPTLGPLILSSIASTEERVITLESRAFTAPVPKTRLYVVTKRRMDTAIEIIVIVAFVAVVAGRIALSLL